MPVTLSARAIGDALARLQEHEIDAESALSWLGWDREAPLRIRRYDLQLYLWYQLPTKYLAPLEAKRDVAAALASLLELAGADAYAALCRAPDVDHMLGLWEDDDPAAPRRLDELLDASGLEPPDTELLTWGPVMGLVEADVRDRAAEVLELALEAGELVPARRSQLVAAVLAEPVDGGTRLDAIHAERLENWRGRRSPARTAIVGRVAESLMTPSPIEAAGGVEPACWLLARGEDGVALTQTGALARSLVREAVERWPHWWNSELFGPPNREAEIAPLHRLHWLLREMRLLRRSGRRLRTTARGRGLRSHADARLAECAEALLAGDTFEAAVGELTAALLLSGEPADPDRLAEPVHAAIAADGWHSNGEAPSRRDISRAVSGFLLRAEPVGIVAWHERRPTAAGLGALHNGLRARALGPARSIL
jgi:hypothetical protein